MYHTELKELGIEVNPSWTGRHKTKCPWCQDSRSSKNRNDKPLSVDVSTGYYKCHHCEQKGMARKDEKYERPSVEPTTISQQVIDFFLSREIPLETLELLKVGSQHLNGRDYVAFNYYDVNNVHRNIKYRNIKDKKDMRQMKGAKPVPYNAQVIRNAPYIIITEGEPDVMAWVTAGLLYTISGPNGSNANWIDGIYEELEQIESIYIAVDCDDKGQKYEQELSRRFPKEKLYRINYDKWKDANDILIENGREAGSEILKHLYDTAAPYPVDGIEQGSSFQEQSLRYFLYGYPDTYYTGIEELDQLWSLHLEDLTIVSGTPNSGKSNFVDWLTVKFAASLDWKAAFYSGEKTKEVHLTGLAYKKIEKSREVLDPQNPKDQLEVLEAINWCGEHFFYLSEGEDGDMENTPDKIIEKAEYLVRRHGIRILVVDNFTTMDTSPPRGMEFRDYIGKILGRFTQFAKRNQCKVFLVVHPRKMTKLDDGKYVIPDGYDLYSSSHFFNLTDNGISLRAGDGYTDVKVWKVRHQEFVGKPGTATLAFDKDGGRSYHSMDGEQPFEPKQEDIYIKKFRTQFGEEDEEEVPFEV